MLELRNSTPSSDTVAENASMDTRHEQVPDSAHRNLRPTQGGAAAPHPPRETEMQCIPPNEWAEEGIARKSEISHGKSGGRHELGQGQNKRYSEQLKSYN